MNDADEELKPEGCVRGACVEKDEVSDVEDDQGLDGAVAVLGLHCLPVDAEVEVDQAHASLQKD